MAFGGFAGFVEGLFRGMDWREGRDDRATRRDRDTTRFGWEGEDREWDLERRDWARDDRAYALSERARVAGERAEGRTRAASARASAETLRQQDREVLGEFYASEFGSGSGAPSGGSGGSAREYPLWVDEPVSVMDVARNRSAPAASNAAPQPVAAPVEAVDPRPRPVVSLQHRNDDAKLGPAQAATPAPPPAPAPAQRSTGPTIENNEPIPSVASARRDAIRRDISVAEYWNGLSPEQRLMLVSATEPRAAARPAPVATAPAPAPAAQPTQPAQPAQPAVREAFSVAQAAPSQADQLAAFRARHGVQTAPAADAQPADQFAPIPTADSEFRDVLRRAAQQHGTEAPALPQPSAQATPQQSDAAPAPRDRFDERADDVWSSVRDRVGEAYQAGADALRAAGGYAGTAAQELAAAGATGAGYALSAVGAPGAGAEALRAGEFYRHEARRPDMTRGEALQAVSLPSDTVTPTAPAARPGMSYGYSPAEVVMPPQPARGSTQAAPAPAPAQPTPAPASVPSVVESRATAQLQPQAPAQPAPQAQGQVPYPVPAPARAVVPPPAGGRSAAPVPTTPSNTPMQSVATVQQTAISVAPAAGRGARTNVRREREQVAERFTTDYRQNAAQRVIDHYIATGRFDRAREFQEWLDERGVQQGMRAWARAIHAYSVNDIEGMVEGLVEAYEAPGYYEDGLSVVRNRTSLVQNDDGEVIGADITFRDNASGRQFTQQVRGINDLVAVGIGSLAPEAAFEQMMELTLGRRQPAPQQTISTGDMISIRRQAYDELSQNGLRQPSPAEVDGRVQQILGSLGAGASGVGARQVPVMH